MYLVLRTVSGPLGHKLTANVKHFWKFISRTAQRPQDVSRLSYTIKHVANGQWAEGGDQDPMC